MEDIAYCLLGIFDVNMPLLYGEGHKAFYRLQEQIIRETGDDSILAWDYFKPEHINEDIDLGNVLLAPSPDFFSGCRNVQHCRRIAWNDVVDLTNHGLRFKSHYINGYALQTIHRGGPYPSKGEIVLLNCHLEDKPGLRLALRLQGHADDGSGEKGYSVLPQARDRSSFQTDVLWAMSVGLFTRLVLVDREGGQIGRSRESCLITRTLPVEEVSFRAITTVGSSHRLEFEQVLRPSIFHAEGKEQSLSPVPPIEGVEYALTVEEHGGNTWSFSLPSHNRREPVTVGACIRDRMSKKSFLLICGRQDSNISQIPSESGDYGLKLQSCFDNTYESLAATNRHSAALLALANDFCKSRHTPLKKRYTLHLPGMGIVTATCDIADFEGPTMNVRVNLDAEEKHNDRNVKGDSFGRRFSGWISGAQLRSTALESVH